MIATGVDPVATAQTVTFGAFVNTGQICISMERIHLHEQVADEFVDANSATLLKQDATWTLRRGLADSSCYSFESVNYPGRFLRHADSRIRTATDDGSALFRQDATFCARPGIGGQGVNFASINIPGS
ncbi:aldehyde dehydrogenase family protein [Streptomyces coelicoflavus]